MSVAKNRYLKRAVAIMLCMLSLLSMISPGASAIENSVASMFQSSSGDAIDVADSSGIVANKYVEATDSDDEFVLTLESFSQGSSIILPKDEPMDIVFVLDQSGSMHAPVGVTDNLYNDKIYNDIPGALTAEELDLEKAQYQGYYIAQSHSGRPTTDANGNKITEYDWFIVWYHNGYWYYVRNANHFTPVNFDLNGSANTMLIGSTLKRTEPYTTFVYYKTQFGALHDAMLEFIDDVKETGVNHKIAITGFASPFFDGYDNYDGSGIYLDGEYYLYDTDFLQDSIGTAEDRLRPGVEQVYDKALVDISTDEGYESIVKSAKAVISNYWHTCPAAGLHMANNIFKETYKQYDSLNGAEPERERMIILFTDGYPTTATGADYVNRNDASKKNLYWEDEDKGIYPGRNDAIAFSYQSIHYFVADIYTVGTSLMNQELFLEYVSSNYPDSQSLTNVGEPLENGKYHSLYNSAEDLSNVFASIMETSTQTEITLGMDAYTKEFITDYFELYGDSVDKSGIKVYTADYLGNGQFAEEVEYEDAEIVLESSRGDGRIDVVKVNGFDYSGNYIVEATEDTEVRGKKLIIKVPVRAREGFWGGNNIPTNTTDTAIYSPDTEDAVLAYPVPEVNIPRVPVVKTSDNVIYIGTEIENSDVFQGITIDGVDVVIGEDGSLSPAEDWMDDFTTIRWADNSSTNSTEIDNKNGDSYSFGVVLTPAHSGTENLSQHPSNLVGSIMSTNGVAGEGTGDVEILVPVITFRDSTINYGESPDKEYFESSNKAEVVWVSKSTGEELAPTKPDTEPALNLTYSVAGTTSDSEDEYYNFKYDTKIDVTVESDNFDGASADITSYVYFKWDCDESLHTFHQDIADHTGSADSIEFWIHVHVDNLAIPDTVVVDFGIPVDINVLINDYFGDKGVLCGIDEYDDTFNPVEWKTTLWEGFGDTMSGTYGNATYSAENGTVRYELSSTEMNSAEKFLYAVDFTADEENPGYYYGVVTIIPATTIYYEDNFVIFESLIWQQKAGGYIWEGDWVVDEDSDASVWSEVGTADSAVQAEDRPGFDNLTDANNIYGYDSAYQNMTEYSLGSAMKATVDYDHAARASFNFYGTGFDIIGLTNASTGTIFIDVYKLDTNGQRVDANTSTDAVDAVKNHSVDTYYGYQRGLYEVTYTYEKDKWVKTVGEKASENATENKAVLPENPAEGDTVTATEYVWVVNDNAEDSIYQVPVMKINGLDYGRYEVVVRAVYEPAFDHVDGSLTGSYDFYLDAVRIYDPANNGDNNTEINDAYLADNEGWPSYLEVRNQLISSESLGNADTSSVVDGMVYIDGDSSIGNARISDYLGFGPNNEVYLAPGQRIAFILACPDIIDRVHIGMKSADGKAVTVSIANISAADNADKDISAGDYYGETTLMLNTSADMYYDLSQYMGDIIVISNTGDSSAGIVALTNIKSTYTANPDDNNNGEEQAVYGRTYAYITPVAAQLAVDALNAPEETEPATTESAETSTSTEITETTDGEEVTTGETEGESCITGPSDTSEATDNTSDTTDATEPTEAETTDFTEDTSATDPAESTTETSSVYSTETTSSTENTSGTDTASSDSTEASSNVADSTADTTDTTASEDTEQKLGDVNKDGRVNVKDATMIQKHLASLVTLDEAALGNADTNADGNVNVKDATVIQKFIAGLIDALVWVKEGF